MIFVFKSDPLSSSPNSFLMKRTTTKKKRHKKRVWVKITKTPNKIEFVTNESAIARLPVVGTATAKSTHEHHDAFKTVARETTTSRCCWSAHIRERRALWRFSSKKEIQIQKTRIFPRIF